ncbi:PIR protein [Plasmodium vivax]|uniref:VIR protein n=1 Tax=Plasmodium vivax TaxID=5855 RepID=A0A565A5Z0_PLAVI|nr:PIR protein [Plasmodium vivax]
MSKELYNFVSSYAKYEKIINVSNDEITEVKTDSCNRRIFTKNCSDESFFRKYLIAKNYLNHIKKHDPPVDIKDACKYLSYWAYQEVLKDSAYSYNVPTFLDKVMKAESIDVCNGYTENITEEVFLEIKSLIDLYKSLAEILISTEQDACQRNDKCVELYENFQDNCELKSDNHLCNEVEKFRKTYNHLMYKTYKCNEFEYLPSYQKHSEVSSITTPIVAFSAMSFVSFITYKFTPFGSWIRNRISGGNNLMNKIDKKNKETQYNSERQDTPYRVGYHSSR